MLGENLFTKFAVFLPIVTIANEKYILFQVRSETLKRQPGEICFPGGHIEKSDTSPETAAIRETCEELGLAKSEIEVIAPLDTLITPFNTIIYSYAGYIKNMENINLNKNEVAEIFLVPISFFLETEPDEHYIKMLAEPSKDFPLHLIPGGYNYNWRVGKFPELFYLYENRVIWGLTARIVSNFIEIVKESA